MRLLSGYARPPMTGREYEAREAAECRAEQARCRARAHGYVRWTSLPCILYGRYYALAMIGHAREFARYARLHEAAARGRR